MTMSQTPATQNNHKLHLRRTSNGFDVPVHYMRGGTSTGVVLWNRLFPESRQLREELVRHVMGLPLSGRVSKNPQITGLGRGNATSNKVFFTDIEDTPTGSGLVSELAQAAATTSAIDWSVNCGNMTAALQLWALDSGLFEYPSSDTFEVAIRNLNTGITSTSRMVLDQSHHFERAAIPGVLGEYPAVDLFLHDPVGNITNTLLPTGNIQDEVAGVAVTCVDVAVPMVIIRADALGIDGLGTAEELENDRKLHDRLREIRIEAGMLMGLKFSDGTLMGADALGASETIPKMCLVTSPSSSGSIAARYFTPQTAHPSMAVSGACCLAASCLIEGSVAADLARGIPQPEADWQELEISVENPAGILLTRVRALRTPDELPQISRAAYQRSTQILLRGLVPIYHPSYELEKFFADNV